jgi:hypothetical protein
MLLGLLSLATGCTARVVQGVLEFYGGRVLPTLLVLSRGTLHIEAITFGHTILATGASALEACRQHERVHVRQYEVWGVFFLLLYPTASLVAVARGGHFYFDNAFEKVAFRHPPGTSGA